MIPGSSFGQVMGLLLPTFWSCAAGLEPEAVIAGFQDMAVVGKSIDAPVMHGDGRIDRVAAQRPEPGQRAVLVGAE